MSMSDRSNAVADVRDRRFVALPNAVSLSRFCTAWTSIGRAGMRTKKMAFAIQVVGQAASAIPFRMRAAAASASTITASRLKIGRNERHGVDEADSNR